MRSDRKSLRRVLRHWLLICFFILGISLSATADIASEPQDVYRLLMLVEYIGSDYVRGVENGRVISAAEYSEMQEFSQALEEQYVHAAKSHPPARAKTIVQRIQRLRHNIAKKAAIEAIREDTAWLRREFYSIFSDSLKPPAQLLDLKTTRILYIQHCVLCHGPKGQGDGPSAKTLDPAPRNFGESASMLFSSPAKSFHVVSLGIEGTAMAAFPDLSINERWSLAFYVNALRHLPATHFDGKGLPPIEGDKMKALLDHADAQDLDFLSRHSDQDLLGWISSLNLGEISHEAGLAAVRVYPAFASTQESDGGSVVSGMGTSGGGSTDGKHKDYSQNINLTLDLLAKGSENLQAGKIPEAKRQVLDAYLLGFDPLEAALGLHHAGMVRTIEGDFIELRGLLAASTQEEFRVKHQNLVEKLERVRDILATDAARAQSPQGWGAIFASLFASFIIIFREGFEAFLIIGALLALVRSLQSREARLWIHAGWVSAALVGVGSFWLVSKFLAMTKMPAAILEGIFTGAAAVVLFYVSFWLMSQSERMHWEKYLKAKTKEVLTRRRLQVLFALSFFAVFREALETVLFYQALILQSSQHLWTVPTGFLVGVIALAILCFAIQQYGLRIPLRRFFFGTSIAMMVIAFVLIGKAIHEFVEAGVVQGTYVAFLPTIDLLGLYPLIETWAAQGVFLLLCVGLSLWLRRPRIEPIGS